MSYEVDTSKHKILALVLLTIAIIDIFAMLKLLGIELSLRLDNFSRELKSFRESIHDLIANFSYALKLLEQYAPNTGSSLITLLTTILLLICIGLIIEALSTRRPR